MTKKQQRQRQNEKEQRVEMATKKDTPSNDNSVF